MKAWIDVETTGLNSEECAIIQLSCVLEGDNGEMLGIFNSNIKPFKNARISQQALEVNGKTIEEIMTYRHQRVVAKEFVKFLDEHKVDKFIFSGYNVQFDVRFVEELFSNNELRFNDYFDDEVLCVYNLALLIHNFIIPQKFKHKKLISYCEYYGIEINAHDSLSDILATRELYARFLLEMESKNIDITEDGRVERIDSSRGV